jgi:hypothetical protein
MRRSLERCRFQKILLPIRRRCFFHSRAGSRRPFLRCATVELMIEAVRLCGGWVNLIDHTLIVKLP